MLLLSLGFTVWSYLSTRRRGKAVETTIQAVEQEEARRLALIQGAALLRPADEPWQRGDGIGQDVIAAIGSAGTNQLTLLAAQFTLSNVNSFVARPFLAEPDDASRAACVRDLPAGFPQPVQLSLPLLPAGLKGATVQEALDLQRYWMPDLDQAIDAWLTSLRTSAKPVCLFMPVSPGGSAALGWHTIRRFKAEYDQADVFVALVLDHKTDRRSLNLPQLLDLYGQDELVRGFLVLENRRSSEQFDHALATLLPSFLVAPWIDPRPQSGFNVLPDVFRVHRVATLRTWQGWLPVHHVSAAESLPGLYYTDLSFAQAQAIRGITEVLTDPGRQSVPLPTADRPHFVYVAAPIRPEPHYRVIAERVRHAMAAGLTFDTTLSFASIGYPLDPITQQAPMTVVSILPITSGIAGLKDYIVGTSALVGNSMLAPHVPVSSFGGANGRRRE
jgi:hypothetical protein